MIQSIYNFISDLVGHVWLYPNGQQYNTYAEQPYLYVASLVIIILSFIVAIDLLYKFIANIFNFHL